MEYMGATYMAEGIVTLAGSRLYTSAAYDEAMIDDVIARFDKVFASCGNVDRLREVRKKQEKKKRSAATGATS